MASVEKLPSGRYRGVYYLAVRPGEKPRKRRVKGTFAHKRAATDAAIEAEARGISDPQHDPNRGRITWAAWEAEWWPTRILEPETEKTNARYSRLHVRPRWGGVALADITHHDVQTWVTSLSRDKGLAASSVGQAFRILSASMLAALRAGHVRATPCVGVRLPALPPAPERFLTGAETRDLFRQFSPRYRVLVELLLETGVRIGEAAGLHAARVDWTAKTVDVLEQWSPAGGVVKPTKGKNRRTVPLTPHLEAVLTEWLEEHPAAETCGLPHAHGTPCWSGLLLPSPHGIAIDAHNFTNRTFRAALTASKIGHARPHDLRHTWASRLLTNGVPLELVQYWAGHATISTTQRYAHLMNVDAELYRRAMAASAAPPAELRAVK